MPPFCATGNSNALNFGAYLVIIKKALKQKKKKDRIFQQPKRIAKSSAGYPTPTLVNLAKNELFTKCFYKKKNKKIIPNFLANHRFACFCFFIQTISLVSWKFSICFSIFVKTELSSQITSSYWFDGKTAAKKTNNKMLRNFVFYFSV